MAAGLKPFCPQGHPVVTTFQGNPMTPHQFAELARQNYNRIPVTREILADLETPLSCYLKLARGPYSYLFESVEGGEKWGRYSLFFVTRLAKTGFECGLG